MSDPFTYTVIGKAMQVHRELGPGLDEVFYHELLSQRLRQSGIAHESRPRGRLLHRGSLADLFEADLLFPSRLVAELKCLHGGFDSEHYLQIICYLKFWHIETGMLFDFGKESLLYRRVNYSEPTRPTLRADKLLEDAPNLGNQRALAAVVCQSVTRIAGEYGFGYRDTTYRGLLTTDLTAEGIGCVTTPLTPVRSEGTCLGEARCNCLAVESVLGVLVLALRDTVTAADRAVLQTYLRLLDFQVGLIVNFGKESLTHRWVLQPSISQPISLP